jgi:hypothetical protein
MKRRLCRSKKLGFVGSTFDISILRQILLEWCKGPVFSIVRCRSPVDTLELYHILSFFPVVFPGKRKPGKRGEPGKSATAPFRLKKAGLNVSESEIWIFSESRRMK